MPGPEILRLNIHPIRYQNCEKRSHKQKLKLTKKYICIRATAQEKMIEAKKERQINKERNKIWNWMIIIILSSLLWWRKLDLHSLSPFVLCVRWRKIGHNWILCFQSDFFSSFHSLCLYVCLLISFVVAPLKYIYVIFINGFWWCSSPSSSSSKFAGIVRPSWNMTIDKLPSEQEKWLSSFSF